MMKETKTVYILNAFGYKNKGDAAILISMVDAIKKIDPSLDFKVESWNYRKDKSYYQEDVYPPFWRFNTKFWEKIYGIPTPSLPLNIIEGVRKLPLLSSNRLVKKLTHKLLLTKTEKEAFRELNNSSLILSCGGGFINDTSGATFLRHLYSIELANRLDIPVMIYSQSIGPFLKNRYARLTQTVLNGVDWITLRDHISKEHLEEIGVDQRKVVVAADAAFTLEPADTKTAEGILSGCGIDYDDNKLLVGITARDWNFPESKNPQESKNAYVNSLLSVIGWLLESKDARVVFLPQTEEDTEIQKFLAKKSGRGNIKVLDLSLHPAKLKAVSGLMDLFIGTRMHSTIFSMSMGVPTISIAYLPKSVDLMNRIGMEDYVIEINKISPEWLRERVNASLNNRDHLKRVLRKETLRLKRLAKENAKKAVSLIS